MRIENFRWLAAAIALHSGHQIVGRTKLQKTIWFLQRLGLPTNYGYKTHFYGPYSEDLQSEVELLESLGIAEEVEKVSAGKNTPYYIIQVKQIDSLPLDSLPPSIKKAVPLLDSADATVLELAATYDAFRDQGSDHKDAIERVRRKKGAKCDRGKLDEALEFVGKLGLPSAA